MIVALPYEKVTVAGGKVTIFNAENPQGLVLDEEKYLPEGEITRGEMTFNLGDDEYFVLGDNRKASSDSRVWGILPEKLIIGKTWIRAFPLSRLGINP